MDPVDLALRFTLLDLLLRPIGDWTVRPFILSLASLGLLLPHQQRRLGLWFALTFLTGLRVVLDWPLADNHAYLLCYWCLAISISLATAGSRACLSLNGRLLIAWTFVFAASWKILSPDYLDGRFFRVMLLTDPRFEAFTQLVGGLTPGIFEELRAFVEQHVDGHLFDPVVAPGESARFLSVAYFATWWTLLLEGTVAMAFLWPLERGLSKFRDVFLLIFCVSTYAVAPVVGFGWLLLAMGVAQSNPDHRMIRILYLGVFGLILFYREVSEPMYRLIASLT